MKPDLEGKTLPAMGRTGQIFFAALAVFHVPFPNIPVASRYQAGPNSKTPGGETTSTASRKEDAMSVPWPDTICPVCGRLVDLDTLRDGNRVMGFHFIAPRKPKECDGSRRSVAVAWTYAKGNSNEQSHAIPAWKQRAQGRVGDNSGTIASG